MLTARDIFFEKSFNRAFGRMEDHQFRGFNRALGCFVEGKDHYKILLKRKGLIPFEEAERLCQEFDDAHRKPKEYELSAKAIDVINCAKLTMDKNGNIKLGERAINALIEMGAIGNDSNYEPLGARKGGFACH